MMISERSVSIRRAD